MNFEIDYVKKLAKILSDNNLSEMSLENGDGAIVLRREAHNNVQTVNTVVQPAAQQAAPAAAEPAAPEKKPAEEDMSNYKKITSPMVGIFYAAHSPEEAPIVKVGDIVSKGQVVCIIEAMKLMNKIESDVSGKIVKVCVENGTAVEYGQVLMYVE